MSHYDTLGINKNASADEIKKAYRVMAHKYHPDKTQGDKTAEIKFKEANNAYEVLGDPQKKSQYDKYGSVNPNQGQNQGGFGGGFSGGFGGGQSSYGGFGGFEDMDFGDGMNINDFINQFVNQGRQQRPGSQGSSRTRGVDIEQPIDITLEEVAVGLAKTFEIKHNTICKHCTGKGFEPHTRVTNCNTCKGNGRVYQRMQTLFGVVQQEINCPDCDGRGKIYEQKCTQCGGQGYSQEVEPIKIQVPVGISQDERIRVKGKGHAGYRGTEAGDLYLVAQILPHPKFDKDGINIISSLELDYFDYVLGVKVIVPTVWGDLEVNIPANTNPDSKLKIKEKGLPRLNNAKVRGDHILKLKVKMPNLSAEQIEKLKEIKG
jgi:molecular chaperone DnaJ